MRPRSTLAAGRVHPGDGVVVERGAGPVRCRRRQHRRERVERCREHLGERPVRCDHHQRLAPRPVEHAQPDRQVVEQLVGDDHADEAVAGHVGSRLDTGRVQCPLRLGDLDGDVAQRRGAARRRRQHRAGQRPRPGAGVDDGERVRPPEGLPLGVEEAGEDGAEQRAHLGRGDEVATAAPGPPDPLDGSGVEAVRAVQGEPLELGERDRPAGGVDRGADGFGHRPILAFPGHAGLWPLLGWRLVARTFAGMGVDGWRRDCERMFVAAADASILHADLDSFFASVEQRDEPSCAAAR